MKKLMKNQIEEENLEEFEQLPQIFFLLILVFFVFFVISLVYQYIIAYWESRRVGPVTLVPKVPWSQNRMYIFKGSNNHKNLIPEVRVRCRGEVKEEGSAIKKMNSIMTEFFKLEPSGDDSETTQYRKKHSLPNNARLISIKMDNFKHGKLCHDFIPIDGEAPGSYYTYQMFGDNRIQVTKYIENGIPYVAGICIYIENPELWGFRFRREVIKHCFKYRKYRRRNDYSEYQEAIESLTERNVRNEPVLEDAPEDHEIRILIENEDGVVMRLEDINETVIEEEGVEREEVEQIPIEELRQNQEEEEEFSNEEIFWHPLQEINNEPIENHSIPLIEIDNIPAEIEETVEEEYEMLHSNQLDQIEKQKEKEKEEELIVRFCPILRRKVMSSIRADIVVHQEWDKYENVMKLEECQKCTEILNNEEPPPYASL